MICDLQVWIELRSISAYHFWSSLGTLVHVSLHWHEAKVCNHSLPMPSPNWLINMKEVGSQDPKEFPLYQGTVRAADSLAAGSSVGYLWQQGLASRAHATATARSRANRGKAEGLIWGCGQVGGTLRCAGQGCSSQCWLLGLDTLIPSEKIVCSSAALFFSFN